MNNCLNCGTETANAKFCCLSCSASYNNRLIPKRVKQPQPIKVNPFEQAELTGGCYYLPGGNPGTKALRKHLIRKHGNECMLCHHCADDWQGKPLTLIVDHINGHADDWSIYNIQLVCPNCDSQLSTYKGRNKGNSTRKYTITQR